MYNIQQQNVDRTFEFTLASLIGFGLLIWGLSKLAETNKIRSAYVGIQITW